MPARRAMTPHENYRGLWIHIEPACHSEEGYALPQAALLSLSQPSRCQLLGSKPELAGEEPRAKGFLASRFSSRLR
jgi:hypothetical protein